MHSSSQGESVRVIVVGAGITGLLMARRLTAAGIDATVLEASGRWGGQVHTIEFEGHPVDVGAEAIHLGIPAVKKLVTELGLADRVVPAEPGSSWLATRKGLRPLPAGVGPAGPTRIRPVLDSRILSVKGLARAGLEPLLARRTRTTDDISVGAFLRSRFGDEVTDTFVDPLLGNLHSGDIDRLSLQSTAPQLLGKVRDGASMLPLGRRKKPARPAGAAAPVSLFSSFPTGLRELTDALAEGLDVRLTTRVTALSVDGDQWVVDTEHGQERAQAVVLTGPARLAGDLLDPLRPGVADDLARGRAADVATVVLAFLADEPCDLLDHANGLLLTSRSGRLLKAVTNLSRKWDHVFDPQLHIIRASVGRAGADTVNQMTDEQLVRIVTDELHEIAGTPTTVHASHVERWPGAMPQLEVGHSERMRRVRGRLDGLPPIVLAGAFFDGLGVGSTVKSAEAHATELISLNASMRTEQS